MNVVSEFRDGEPPFLTSFYEQFVRDGNIYRSGACVITDNGLLLVGRVSTDGALHSLLPTMYLRGDILLVVYCGRRPAVEHTASVLPLYDAAIGTAGAHRSC